MRHTAQGFAIPQTLIDVAGPDRMALLVYDMQIGVCGQLPQGEAVTAKVKQVLDAARAARLRVAFTRHMSTPKAWMGVFQHRMAMAWQRTDDPDAVKPWFLRDSPGFAIVEELAPSADEVVFDKLAMSAFEGTPLAFALRDCGLVAMAICGIALEIGIEPTLRHAADLGIVPVLIADACGFGNEEAARRSIEALTFSGDAIITDTAEFCGAVSTR